MIRLLILGSVLLFALAPSVVAGEAIGFAYAGGSYRLDGSSVRGSATLFEGTRVELGDSAVRLQLAGGARVWLAPGSKSMVHASRAVLLNGLAQLEGSRTYALEARAIRVLGSEPTALTRVQVEDGGAVVMPVRGSAEVMNNHGVRVGKVMAGNAVRFAQQPGDPGFVSVSGCLHRDGRIFTLTDQVTNVTVQLEGRDLASASGHLVEVRGVAKPAAPAGSAQVVAVTGIHRSGAGACRASDGGGPVLVASAAQAAAAPGQDTAGPELSIVVVEGEGAINNLRERIVREPIVRVEDRNRRPVAGALVVFALPGSGPGGVFADGARTLTVTTDQQGRAVARGFRPNDQVGEFQIEVTATSGGQTATTTIRQRNALTAAAVAAAATMGIGTKIAIIGGIAAAGTLGGLAASGAIFGSDTAAPQASR